MKIRLEDKLIRALGPGDYYDTVRRRLVLRVRRDGARRYVIRYRAGTKPPKRYRIGDAMVMNLAAARNKAKRLLAKIDAEGWDPLAEKRQARHRAGTQTFKALAARFVKREKKNWRPKTAKEFQRILEKLIVPEFGSASPDEIKRGDIRLWAEQLAESTPTMANRAFEVLRRIFTWAVEKELVNGSPVVGLKKPARETARERAFSDAELQAIVAAAKGTEYERVVGLVLHTGVRSHEARSARWQDMDLQRKLWTIPALYTKASRHARKPEPRLVPLSEQAIAFLRELSQRDLGFVFAADTKECDTCAEKGHVGKDTRPVTRIRKRSEVKDFTLHPLRATVGDRITQEFGDAIKHLVLGHSRGMLARTYGPTPPLKMARQALDWWGAELARILAPKRDEAGA